MANFDTNLFRKNNKHRGVYGGKEQTVTGTLRVSDGESIALTDLIRAVPMGEKNRPIRLAVSAFAASGTPVLTNATFNAGVAPLSGNTFVRPDGTEYAPLTADADALAAALAVTLNEPEVTIAVTSPSATSDFGPYVVTLTPAGVGAFSVAGGDIDLNVTVTFLGEQKVDGFIYDEYVNQNVNNQT